MAKIKKTTPKQKSTYWLKKADGTGEFDGRDNDKVFPGGTFGRKDTTKSRHDVSTGYIVERTEGESVGNVIHGKGKYKPKHERK